MTVARGKAKERAKESSGTRTTFPPGEGKVKASGFPDTRKRMQVRLVPSPGKVQVVGQKELPKVTKDCHPELLSFWVNG